MKYEIEIPDGYEATHTYEPVLTNNVGIISVAVIKKQNNLFFEYIDEYLNAEAASTSDNIVDSITTHSAKSIADRLKKGRYDLVPWEIKIGLIKFICEQNEINDVFTISKEKFKKVTNIPIPHELINSI